MLNLGAFKTGFSGGAAGKKKKKNHLPMQEMLVWSVGQEDPLKEGMATHSSVLAWRTPWTEEPGGLQSMGSQGVGHDQSDLARMPCSYNKEDS